MSEPPVLIGRDGAVGEVVLNRPAALNAVTVALTTAFVDAVAALVAGGARAIIVRGAGTSFCAGGDVDELAAVRDAGPDGLRRLFGGFRAMCEAVERAPVPVVAAVHGFATAGGFELVQSCDVVLVADDARLADNHTNFAMLPGGGGTQRLARLVGRQRALAHILTGDRLTGAEAVRWGLAYRAVPAAELHAAAAELARRLAAKDPATVAGAKALVRAGLALPLAEGLDRETDAVVAHLARPGALDRLTTVTTTTQRSAP